MKLRIRGNSIRFRLSQTEMVQLVGNGAVSDSVQFSPEMRLDYGVAIRPVENLEVSFAGQSIQVAIPTAMARNWAAPEEVAIRGEQALTGDASLSILLEKDFVCLTPRDGEEDDDSFPNPASTPG